MTYSNNIDAVSPKKLSEAIDNKHVDESSQILKKEEEKYINAWKEKNGRSGDSDVTGLALSGGGIRSATFSLGVMQALAKHNKLGKFDYLSTVSGGGYIGCAITWFLSGKSCNNDDIKFGVNQDDFPFGTDDPRPEFFETSSKTEDKIPLKLKAGKDEILDPANANQNSQNALLEFVRHRANYLNPEEGISILALLGAVLRGMLLNLMVWLPLLVSFFIISLGFSTLISLELPILSKSLELIFSGPFLKNAIASLEYLAFFEGLIWFGLMLICCLFLILIIYSLTTYTIRTKTPTEIDKRYIKRFKLEKILPIFIIAALVSLIIGSLPISGLYFQEKFSSIGPVAALGGSFFLLRYFIRLVKNKPIPISLSVNVFASIFLYSFVLIAFQLGLYVLDFLNGEHSMILKGIPFTVILLAVLLGYFVNLNYISIHRFYRDRLMETFMPDIKNVQKKHSQHYSAMDANKTYLYEFSCKDDADNVPNCPYHIVNTNLVLVNSEEYTYTYRGGDNFILSPLYCGSNATGWCPTDEYMEGRMTLATAVAISGAALNPNTGTGGDGITRSKLLSFVMSLLNLRLGYWAHHPIEKPTFFTTPNHFKPGNYSLGNLLGYKGNNEKRPYLQLTDGGHFENTGIYELIRRQARLILACDGGEDHAFSFSDFQTTVRRIEDDFGARVSVDDNYSVDGVVPKVQDSKNNKEALLYPPDAKFADRGFILAKITYSNGTEGILIYLKTTMPKDISFKVKGYKAQNPLFPDESTADQFFDEVQFEAYRELGYRITSQMIEELEGKIENF